MLRKNIQGAKVKTETGYKELTLVKPQDEQDYKDKAFLDTDILLAKDIKQFVKSSDGSSIVQGTNVLDKDSVRFEGVDSNDNTTRYIINKKGNVQFTAKRNDDSFGVLSQLSITTNSVLNDFESYRGTLQLLGYTSKESFINGDKYISRAQYTCKGLRYDSYYLEQSTNNTKNRYLFAVGDYGKSVNIGNNNEYNKSVGMYVKGYYNAEPIIEMYNEKNDYIFVLSERDGLQSYLKGDININTQSYIYLQSSKNVGLYSPNFIMFAKDRSTNNKYVHIDIANNPDLKIINNDDEMVISATGIQNNCDQNYNKCFFADGTKGSVMRQFVDNDFNEDIYKYSGVCGKYGDSLYFYTYDSQSINGIDLINYVDSKAKSYVLTGLPFITMENTGYANSKKPTSFMLKNIGGIKYKGNSGYYYSDGSIKNLPIAEDGFQLDCTSNNYEGHAYLYNSESDEGVQLYMCASSYRDGGKLRSITQVVDYKNLYIQLHDSGYDTTGHNISNCLNITTTGIKILKNDSTPADYSTKCFVADGTIQEFVSKSDYDALVTRVAALEAKQTT